MSEDDDHEKSEPVAGTAPVAVPSPILFSNFLESVPPSQVKEISDLFAVTKRPGYADQLAIRTPELQLHCSNETCNGLRFFRYESGEKSMASTFKRTYLTFVCSNCQRSRKTYSLQVVGSEQQQLQAGTAYKFGEVPVYGPPTPPRLLRLFGKDRDLFLKGRRCENQGLGIAAFVYYRRVVENQKNKIFDEVIRVAKKVGALPEMIEKLETGKAEIQFTKSLSSAKDAIPQALLVDGHNPLSLLHSALSVGVHDLTDERCLELAHDIRVVMAELADRLGSALKDEAELNQAVSRLLQPRS